MKRILCAVVSALFAVSAIHGEETAAIEGQVLLAQTGAPVAGATVNLLETGASTIADEQGRFQFEGVRPGRYHLYAHIESALRGVSEAIEVVPESTAGVQLLLSFSTQKTQITVSAAGRPESAFEALQPTHSLTALELARAANIAAGLGEVLGNQPGTGIAQRGFGPGSSRPVIRGFDGDRVLIMADGLRTGSISATSGDHVETFNPLSFDRLEVVKGPATLLYGSNAMGGVVNAVSSHAGFVSHPDGLQGYLQGSAGTGNALAGGAAGFDYAGGSWRMWGGANGLRSGDYATPLGDVENSRTRATNGYGGFGWFGERAFVSVGVRANGAKYGVPFAGEFHSHGHHEEEGEEHHAAEEEGDEHAEAFPDAIRRRFTGASAAAGIHADLWRGGAFVANYSHSYRAPALEELYNVGPHVGTLIFEVGDPGLRAERGNGIDLSLRQQVGRVDGEVNLFYYDFRNFVFPFATGEEEDGLPVVHFVQRDSRFNGAEARLGIGLRQDLRLNLGVDFTDAKATLTDTPLPRIPPLRGRVGIEYQRRGFSIRPELLLADRQSQTLEARVGLDRAMASYASADAKRFG